MKRIILAIIVVISMTACKSTHDLQVIHDTIHVSKVEKDVQIVYDSVYIDRWHTQVTEGDTVLIVDSVLEYRYRLLHDTVRTYDTIYKINDMIVEKEVKKTKAPAWAWWSLGILLMVGAIGVRHLLK